MALEGAKVVRVKEELEWESEVAARAGLHTDTQDADTQAGHIEHDLKEESGAHEESMAALAALYPDHIVKEELMVGPVELHQPKVVLVHTDTQEAGAQAGHEEHEMKEEPGGPEEGACGVSAAAARTGRHTDRTVKEELVVDPEELQQPEVVFVHAGVKALVKSEPADDDAQDDSLLDVLYEVAIDKSERSSDDEASKALHPLGAAGALEPARPVAQHAADTQRTSYDCEVCHKRFPRKLSLNRHKWTHTGSETKQHQLTHTQKRYTCDICQLQLAHSSSLSRHIRTHTAEKYTCEVCSKSFRDSWYYRQHRQIHARDKLFICEMCKKEFTLRGNLIKHFRIHTGHRRFKCEICCKAFADNSTLKQHKRTHTGEKLYACDTCEAEFAHKSSLNRHVRTHTGEKPYGCNVCSKKFADGSALKHHQRTHTDNTHYSCDVCKKRYLWKSDLNKHNRRHAGKCKI